MTFALNTYLNQYFRASLNYVHVLDIEGGSFADKDLNALQLRLQFAY